MRLKTFLLTLFVSLGMMAANTVTTQGSRITSAVNVGANVDYTLTLSTNIFSSSGTLNIPSNAMEHSVIIFQNVKPSVVISTWLRYIRINGATATNGSNCQVRMYNKGAIVFPYSSSLSPLTCYTENNFQGANCATYTTGHEGGFMKTLTQATLLNSIKSFKLKRGYMVTFATGTGGWGYSRCFIAAYEDLEMNLPPILANKVSSYRVFEFYNFGKTALASDTRAEATSVLNVQGCYDWGQGNGSTLPDVEWVCHHIYEDWPPPATCGSVTHTPHMKTNNEPRNGADDHPQDLATILNNWQNLMRTGLRLCSPSSWDGSDYWDGAGFLDSFIKAIDARGWRCDIIDAHCYWPEGNFVNLENYWWPRFHRPIWISEWIWGASWNQNGAFASGRTENEIINTTSTILSTLNNATHVERYFYWNSESKAKIYDNGITNLGRAYASQDGGLGYKGNDFTPAEVLQKPYSLAANVSGNNITITWKDKNGDSMDEIRVQYKTATGSSWTTIATIDRKDKTSASDQSYTYSGTLNNPSNYVWRIVDMLDGTEYPSNTFVFAATQIDNSNFLPSNLADFYFQFYSKEATSNLVWAVAESGENRVQYKAYNSNYANDLYQLWALEENSNGGYSLRNVGEPNYLICSVNAWNFETRNANYVVESANTAFDFTYYSNGDYWICTNLAHGMYVGLWDNDKNFAAGEVLAGNRTNPTGNDSGDKLGIRLIPRSAINDALGLISIPSGNYYLYNNQSGLFLAAGNQWDTQAIVSETGVDFALSSSGSGFLLESNISNGGNAHYLGSNLFCDSDPFIWTFATAGIIDGKQAYTIANGNNYLSAPSTPNTAVATTTNANAASAKWLLLTRNDLLNKMVNATEANPIDATFLISCARFGRNDGRINNWVGGPVVGGHAGSDWGDMCGEKYNTTFDVYQLIEDAPDGLYEVSAKGFYRNGGYADAANRRSAGTEALNALLYGNDQTTPLPSIFEGAGSAKKIDADASTAHGYIPDNMEGATYYMHAGLYSVGPLRFTVEGNSLRVGVKKTVAVGNDWTIFDNFKLMYLGPVSTFKPGDVTGDGIMNLQDVIAIINIIFGRPLPTYNLAAADVNNDGNTTLADVTALVNLIQQGE